MTIPDVLGEPLPACPACGTNSWKPAGQVKDYSITGEWFELMECPSCHLRATYPQPKPADIGRYYASTAYISHSDTRKGLINKLYHAARVRMLRQKMQWVTEYSGKTKGRLLDVGAGTGHFGHFMKSGGWDVLALEPDDSARKVAALKLGISIQPLDMLTQLEPDSFDVITLWHVLEHVHDLAGYMDHFRTLLKDHGTLFVAVPNYTSSDGRKYGAQWAAYDVPRHLWHFSPQSMQQLCARHDFNVIRKVPMTLDAYYVSMLSEKYQGHDLLGLPGAFISGCQTVFRTRKDLDQASSILYVIR